MSEVIDRPSRYTVAKKLYEDTDILLKQIAHISGVSGETIRRWANKFNWNNTARKVDYEKSLERVKEKKPGPITLKRRSFDAWPKNQRFDTPGRHLHSLDLAKERRLG